MTIPLNYSPNLAQPGVKKFARDPGPSAWNEQPTPRSGYTMSSATLKKVGELPDPFSIILARQEFYQVLQGKPTGQVVGNFNVIIPLDQKVRVTVNAYLALQTGLDAALSQKIESAFAAYSFPAGGDPEDYLAAQLKASPAVTRKMFIVNYTFALQKIGVLKEHREQFEAIRKVYEGQLPGTISTGPGQAEPLDGAEGGYFKRRYLHFKLIDKRDLDEVPPKQKDPHEQEGNGRSPGEIIDELLGKEKSSECKEKDSGKDEHPVIALLAWPEFRVVWKDFPKEIGCGVWIVVTLPVLETKTSQLELWMYASAPLNIWVTIENALDECMWRGALAGAVVGVVLWNFAAGQAAFKAVFEVCMTYRLGSAVDCLVPGLVDFVAEVG